MEIIELSITAEESENYRKITNRLKVLGAVGWVKAYIWAVVYVVIFCAIGFALAGRYALTIMQYVPVWVWPLCFVAVWMVSAIRRSGNKQLKVLLQKYLFTGFADKIFAGEIRPSRVKILKDKMIVYGNMKIGIFDSGIGGLSVLHQAMIIMPEADYIFYADVDNVPYGEKTKEEVRKLVDHAVGFLVDKGCQAIVLACNTATSAAISYLREKYKLPIIGIEPAVKPAVEHIHESGKRVMVVSTPVTAKGEKLKKLVDKYDNKHIVDVVALPKLVRFAQDDDFDSSDVTDYLKSEFAPYNLNDYSELVLGCTHFNYFKDSFSKLFPDDLEMVDGNTGVSNNLKNTVVKKGIFKEEDKGKKGTVEYYYSDRKMESEAEMKHIKKLHERLERMRQI